jgi:hypothetical protein
VPTQQLQALPVLLAQPLATTAATKLRSRWRGSAKKRENGSLRRRMRALRASLSTRRGRKKKQKKKKRKKRRTKNKMRRQQRARL